MYIKKIYKYDNKIYIKNKSPRKDGSVAVQEDYRNSFPPVLTSHHGPAQHALQLSLHKMFTQKDTSVEERESEREACALL